MTDSKRSGRLLFTQQPAGIKILGIEKGFGDFTAEAREGRGEEPVRTLTQIAPCVLCILYGKILLFSFLIAASTQIISLPAARHSA
jgi:hypothetical protein